MEELLKPISDWFTSKEGHLRAFAECDSRVEGWFKGEFLVLLRNLEATGVIRSFEREPKLQTTAGRKQVDFRVSLRAGDVLLELKAVCISRAAGTPRDLAFYFRDDDVGLVKDFRKLDSRATGNKAVIGFVYPNPPRPAWERIVHGLPDDVAHWSCLTSPGDYPSHVFVSLWRP